MQLDELIEMTFRRGCGVSLEEAMGMPRLGELEAACASHPYPRRAAQVQLLGELLIEAAYKCLPDPVRDFASIWPEMTAEEQLSSLEALCDYFKSDLWYFTRKLEVPRRHKQTASDVLPCEYGHWETGPVCPSCMGMSTMLMAFAKHTGAPHWYAHVLKSIMLEVQGMDFEIGHTIMAFLKKRLPKLAETGEFDELDERYQLVLGEIVRLNRYNFHPALVIQLKDFRWVLCDPYFGTLAVLDEAEWPIAKAVEMLEQADLPGRVAQMGSRHHVAEYRNQLVQESGYIGGFIESIMESVEGMECDGSVLVGAVEALRTIMEHESLSWLKPLMAEIDDQQLYAQGLFPDGTKLTDEAGRRAMELLDHDPEFARRAVERMLAFVVKLWMQRIIDDFREMMRKAPHSSLELAQPANAVAAGTLNNVRVYDGSRPKKVGGELVLYSRSQSIVHDAMLDVLHRKRVSPLVADVLRRMEDSLRTGSPAFLHPYVAALLASLPTEGGAVWQQPI